MADIRKIVKVFLASPGDLQDERRIAKSIVDEFNNLWADPLGYHVELVGWEDTVSVYGRPQETINQDLRRCEYFIGMMWRRWGTPPARKGRYTSGFEEEFRLSMESRASDGRPEISLFFKNVDENQLRDPGDELKKVLAFKKEIISKKTLLFETFDGAADIGEKIRRCITRYVQKLQETEASELSNESQARPTDENVPQGHQPAPVTQPPQSDEGIEFLRQLASRMERDSEDTNHPIDALDIARLRLLGTIRGFHGNDDQTLGVHDANILYSRRDELQLSRPELLGLVDTGAALFSTENAPFWHWLSATGDGFTFQVQRLS
jgi:hypothetical protein